MKVLRSLCWVGFLVAPMFSWGSALVLRDDRQATLRVITQIHFSGSALTPALAYASALEISSLWNQSRAVVDLQGRPYQVEFVIAYGLGNPGVDNGSCAENYVAIEPKVRPDDRSFFELAGRSGVFFTSDGLGFSTTTAHEYGHGLGLLHDDYTQVNAPVPGIMFARGTWVRPEFQYDPKALPGQPGGTLDPRFRKVRREDVARLDFQSLIFQGGVACIGRGLRLPVALLNVIPKGAKRLRLPERRWTEALHPDAAEEREAEAHDH